MTTDQGYRPSAFGRRAEHGGTYRGGLRRVSDETRRGFLSEWFAELRIEPDGGVTMVPREPYPAIVYAAVGTGGRCWIRTSDLCDVNAAL